LAIRGLLQRCPRRWCRQCFREIVVTCWSSVGARFVFVLEFLRMGRSELSFPFEPTRRRQHWPTIHRRL